MDPHVRDKNGEFETEQPTREKEKVIPQKTIENGENSESGNDKVEDVENSSEDDATEIIDLTIDNESIALGNDKDVDGDRKPKESLKQKRSFEKPNESEDHPTPAKQTKVDGLKITDSAQNDNKIMCEIEVSKHIQYK